MSPMDFIQYSEPLLCMKKKKKDVDSYLSLNSVAASLVVNRLGQAGLHDVETPRVVPIGKVERLLTLCSVAKIGYLFHTLRVAYKILLHLHKSYGVPSILCVTSMCFFLSTRKSVYNTRKEKESARASMRGQLTFLVDRDTSV